MVREPEEASMDSGDVEESNEFDKNIPFYLNFLSKIHVCAIAAVIFWQ